MENHLKSLINGHTCQKSLAIKLDSERSTKQDNSLLFTKKGRLYRLARISDDGNTLIGHRVELKAPKMHPILRFEDVLIFKTGPTSERRTQFNRSEVIGKGVSYIDRGMNDASAETAYVSVLCANVLLED